MFAHRRRWTGGNVAGRACFCYQVDISLKTMPSTCSFVLRSGWKRSYTREIETPPLQTVCVCAEIRLSQLCLTRWLAKKEVCSIRKNKSRRNRNPFNYNSHTHVEKRLESRRLSAVVCVIIWLAPRAKTFALVHWKIFTRHTRNIS